jgi:hypothetical protein
MKVSRWLVLGCSVGLVAACGAGDEKKTDRGADGEAGASATPDEGGAGGAEPGGSAGPGGGDAGGDDAGGSAGTSGEDAGGRAGASGEDAGGAAGAQGDGSQQIDEGPPGSVGNPCTAEGACDSDLVCALSLHCQPTSSVLPEQIVQAVPLPDSANIPSQAPIVLFADSTYENVAFTVTAYTLDGAQDITAQVSAVKLTSASGKDVYVLAAKGGLPLGASVVVTISGDMEGTVVFNVDHASPPFAEGALDFEGAAEPIAECTTGVEVTQLPLGWTAFGDVGVVPETGTLVPTSGTKLMAMSSGAVLCGQALGDTSSMLVSGPIRELGDSPVLALDYNFQSSEFDDYCNSEYDDTLIGVLSGPKGAVARVIDSVNLICERALHAAGTFPGLPDGGDEVYKETANLAFELEGDVGSPAVLAFVLTDVGDATLSSLVGIDNIRLVEP